MSNAIEHLKAAAESLRAAAAKLEAENAPPPVSIVEYDAEGIRKVYGREFGDMLPPEGFEWLVEDGWIAFRTPVAGDIRAQQLNDGRLRPFEIDDKEARFAAKCGFRWLILRPKPKPQRWVFEVAGLNRPPKKGEFTLTRLANGELNVLEVSQDFCRPYGVILRLVEQPEE